MGKFYSVLNVFEVILLKSNKISSVIRLTVVYGLILLLVFPLVFMLIWSVTRSWPWPNLLPESITFEVWKDFFLADSRAWSGLGESFIIAVGVMLLAMGISIPAGKALALYKFPGKEVIKILVIAPIIVPPLAVTMGIHVNFLRLGLTGNRIGVILVHLIPVLPYTIKILTHTFEGAGKKLEEQARVLGANIWQRFLYITFPLIKPGIFSAGIMAFIISFSQFILTFLMGEGQVVTFPMILFPMVEKGNRILASVYSWVFILTIIIFTFIMERILKDNKRENRYFYL